MIPFVDRSRALLARTPLPGLWRRLHRPLLWLLLTGYFAFAALVLVLRLSVMPHIADYRDDIERAIGQAINLPVTIASVEADWQGLRPHLRLNGLRIADREGRPALSFDRVEAVLGWSSLLHLDLRLYRLEIDAPQLSMRREANGQIFVAGLPLKRDDGGDSRLSDWVLAQGQIVIRDATLQWDDALRQAPTLVLNKVNLNLKNSGRRHRIGLTAEPPPALAARIDVRGDFRGSDLAALDTWKGHLYAELDYADLAVWRHWIDYPISLPRGSGGVRLWLDFAKTQVSAVTADLALADVQIRLGRELPMLDLQRLHGRISASRDGADYAVAGKKLALVTKATPGSPAGLSLGPLDFDATLGLDDNGRAERMQARCSSLDLGKLDALASYLPLPQEYEKLLGELELQGRIDGLVTSWDGPRKRYALKGDFHDLGISAYDKLPGVRRLSGSIDGSEAGGTLTLAGRDTELSLPSVFAQPDIPLQKLDAKLRWRRDGLRYDIDIDSLRFANADAEGSAQGSYHGRVGSAGTIDLNAQLTRADGTAVWRYLPLAVNQDARNWVKQGVTAGHSNDVRLTLKGDLDKFPFKQGGGSFKVLVKAEGASIHPAAGWPDIHGIDGDLAFVGVGMRINAHKGQILGASLSDVKAEIADLDSTTDQTLTITGKAKGPTQTFLDFIEASPVGARIDHFTKPMSASGNGELDLKLRLTLHDLDQSGVEGSYAFDNNRLQVDTTLPALTETRGRLGFTDAGISVRDARANMLGAPVTINVNTDKDGQINVLADGQFSVAALRKLYPLPLFDQLSGSGRWKGRFAIRKSDVDVRIASDLVGLSSSLPEPLNKSAATPLDLRIERRTLPAAKGESGRRETVDLALGKLLRGQILRSGGEVQRGYVAVGNGAETARIPERGVLLNADLARIDVDFWRRMLSLPDNGKRADTGSSAAAANPLAPFTQVDARAGQVVLLNRTLEDVRINAQQSGAAWKGDLRSKGVSAALEWTPGSDGKPGRLSGRIPQLTIPNPNQQVTEIAHLQDDATEQLPSLALVIDKLNLRGQDWGMVTLDAENRSGYWNTHFAVNNEDANLSGDGRWRPGTNQHDTQISFQLKAKSLEKLLARAGYDEVIRRGSANLQGKLGWNGPPFSIDYPSLSGDLKVDMQNGQFKKLEPGIGRLLGVLSLQSIPRRITLDFRDIFSEGFAFDSIRGDVRVEKGVMQADDLAIAGPSAKVRMSGTVSLPDETQDLHVRVQPVLGDTLAVGAMIANPAVGAVAWLAHKVLKDPIDQAFAFQYRVTGKWDDPQVVKIETGRDINKAISDEVSKQGATLNKEGAPAREPERK